MRVIDGKRQCTECGVTERKTVMLDSSGINKAYICLDCLDRAIKALLVDIHTDPAIRDAVRKATK